MDLNKIFKYHPPKGDQPQRYELIRRQAKEFAQSLDTQVPDSHEKDMAMMNLQQAVMWANAGIARNE